MTVTRPTYVRAVRGAPAAGVMGAAERSGRFLQMLSDQPVEFTGERTTVLFSAFMRFLPPYSDLFRSADTQGDGWSTAMSFIASDVTIDDWPGPSPEDPAGDDFEWVGDKGTPIVSAGTWHGIWRNDVPPGVFNDDGEWLPITQQRRQLWVGGQLLYEATDQVQDLPIVYPALINGQWIGSRYLYDFFTIEIPRGWPLPRLEMSIDVEGVTSGGLDVDLMLYR